MKRAFLIAAAGLVGVALCGSEAAAQFGRPNGGGRPTGGFGGGQGGGFVQPGRPNGNPSWPGLTKPNNGGGGSLNLNLGGKPGNGGGSLNLNLGGKPGNGGGSLNLNLGGKPGKPGNGGGSLNLNLGGKPGNGGGNLSLNINGKPGKPGNGGGNLSLNINGKPGNPSLNLNINVKPGVIKPFPKPFPPGVVVINPTPVVVNPDPVVIVPAPVVVGPANGGTVVDLNQGDNGGQAARHLQRFVQVKNDTAGKLTVFVQYRTMVEGDQWAWLPTAPEGGKAVGYVLAPGQEAVLQADGAPISASRVRIWARTEAGEEMADYRDQDLWLVEEVDGERVYFAPEQETFTLRFGG
jgi:hypothetical protein